MIETYLPFLALGAAFIGIIALVSIILYLYVAFAFFTIGKKLNYPKSWLAWIPIANIAMVLQLGGFHWALVFLILLPILGQIAITVLLIISFWRICEKRNYPGWISLVPLLSFIPIVGVIAGIATLVVIGLVAWRDN